ncbi:MULTISPECIES: septum site-determining protein MinC [Nitrospirillum]|uniref:Probable septum site-determining protein MinC n=1 Tax=Nitrospirillum amazonense TaxID=28077 RepID=A0A560FRS4_9PROT|nr:septum site-determining protein MinC [Nitrospirillum amazonense]MEC4593702.1 septum site-determining protein MinC [Nitrospirillum amazonense]TWB24335.1 septum site-determining protein MinC [Nitrospirillum amazonense]
MSNQVAFRDAPFQLRGSNFTMMVLKVSDPHAQNFFFALSDKVRQAPNFFRNAPVVLDLDDLPPGQGFDFENFCDLLRTLGLIAVGLQGGTREQQEAALAVGLAVFPQGRATADAQPATPRPVAVADAPVAAAPVPAPAHDLPYQKATLLVRENVRSGRQLYAQGGDLVVIGSVSPGAELVADGNIHVYGALRGRALAGMAGDHNARIFCQSLEAEMVSIAGLYRVSEDLEKSVLRRQVQIYLDQGFLHIDPVTV